MATFGHYVVFTYTLRYYRYSWDIEFRYNDLVSLDRVLFPLFADRLSTDHRPVRFNKLFWTHDAEFLTKRSKMMLKYIQDVLDIESIMSHQKVRSFLSVSVSSFNPDMGRKGKEGYLKKSSGGYVEKFSRQAGDYFQMWMWRWIVLHDTCIAWYKSPEDPEPRGALQIDKKFNVQVKGRVITVYTETRKLLLYSSTQRSAEEWATAMRTFYAGTNRTLCHYFDAAFPPRMNCDVKVYTYTRDYFNSVAIAMLSAQTEILITSWKNSPTLVLTRPPYPTLRLDQILKYKADQGIKIFILLYKEVEYVGQGNDSLRSKTYLEGLSPNIRVIRHPNKFIGGSTAMLWSHHEKSVVIDRYRRNPRRLWLLCANCCSTALRRNLCFVGGVDMAFQRWDDEQHRVADEDGIMYAILLPCKVIHMVFIAYVWCVCAFAPVIPVTTTASLRRECSSRCVCPP
jgi:phospholipase D1/2